MEQGKSIRDLMIQYEDDICYLQQMHIYSMSTYEKNYYHEQIRKTTDLIIKQLENIKSMEQKDHHQLTTDSNYYIYQNAEKYGTPEDSHMTEKEFTLEELAEYNGTNGKPPYVAINGIVYDMSNIGPWSGGTHFGLLAGNNLTDQFMGCHRGAQSVLNKLSQVGKMVQ